MNSINILKPSPNTVLQIMFKIIDLTICYFVIHKILIPNIG